MPVWKLSLPVSGSIDIEVHAATEEEARQLLVGFVAAT